MPELNHNTLKVGDKFQNFEYDRTNIPEVEVHVVGQYRSIIKFPNPYAYSTDARPPYYVITPNHMLCPPAEEYNVEPGDYVACVFRNECINGLVVDGTDKTWNVILETGETTKGNRGCKRVKKASVFLLSKAKKQCALEWKGGRVV